MENKAQNEEEIPPDKTIIGRTMAHFSLKIEFLNEKGKKVKKYDCSICGGVINGTQSTNLTLHLRKIHPAIYEKEVLKKLCESLALKRLKLLQNCTEIVTINARPYASLLDSGFQKCIEAQLNELKVGGHTLQIKDDHLAVVKDYVAKVAAEMKQMIAEETEKRILSLILDIGSKNQKSFLGISVRFLQNGRVVTRSLGLIQLHQSHTATYLMKIVEETLEMYSITFNQIIAITTDNGANVLKMVKDINASNLSSDNNKIPSTVPPHNHSCEQANGSRQKSVSAQYRDEDIASVSNEIDRQRLTDRDEIRRLLNAEDEYANILKETLASCAEANADKVMYIHGTKCAAHTLQLVVKDGIDALSPTNSNIINICREAAKHLRVDSYRNNLKTNKVDASFIHLECPTRWSSLYRMVCLLTHSLSIKCFMKIHVL